MVKPSPSSFNFMLTLPSYGIPSIPPTSPLQGDPASTALYCIDIQPFIKQLQQFLLDQGPALPLFFVDDGTIIGPHELILSAIHFVNQHGPRDSYRFNMVLLGRCDSDQTAQRHHRSRLSSSCASVAQQVTELMMTM